MTPLVVSVELSWSEVYRAAQLGARRNIKAHERGRRSLFAPEHDPDLWLAHIGGMIGEFAVAKWLGIIDTWTAETERPDTKVGDVAGLQVRYSVHHGARLVIYAKDPPDHRYMLVTGRLPEDGATPTYCLRGWQTAAHGREVGEERGTAVWVEQRYLYAPADLRLAA